MALLLTSERLNRMQCPRCDAVELEKSSGKKSSTDDPDFFACPQCRRRFMATSDGKLVERWLGPLSLVLYPVIFNEHPQEEAERIANELHAASQPGEESIFRRFSRDELRKILSEIRLELERPTQNIRDILDLRGDEADLREYLALVADRLGMLLDKDENSE
jgi:hypothetical protein